MLWLKEGDRNTQFFHRMANSNRRNNSISTLLIDRELSTDQTAIGKAITQFYTGLYTNEVGWRPKLDRLDFPILSMMMLAC